MKAKNVFKCIGAMLLCFSLLAGTFPAGALAEGVTMPLADETGGFTATGGTQGDYSYADGVLTIHSGTLTLSGSSATDCIVVDGVANLTLDGVNVTFNDGNDGNDGTVSSGDTTDLNPGTCALSLGENANVTLTLAGENTLQSGVGQAGIFVPENASLTIGGEGMLNVTGGKHAAGIGGGYRESNVNIIINGGTVTANGGDGGAGIGGTDDSAIFYPFSTGKNGHAVIFASSFDLYTDSPNWGGVIFQGNTGKVYGTNVSPTEDFTIPETHTLTIDQGQTLIIPEGVTLTNNGSITNSGTIICHGTINSDSAIGGNVSYASAVDVKISGDGVTNADNGYTAPYNTKITITATIQRAQTNGINALADLGEVDFYLGDGNSDNLLGSANVKSGSGGTYTATLEVPLNDAAKWLPANSPYTITAVFSGVAGTSGDGLLSSTGTAALTVTKASQPAPDVQGIAETMQGRNDGKIIGTTAEMEYKLKTADEWTTCNGTEITGLAPGTYLVRAKSTATSFAGAEAEVTIAAGAERTFTLHVTAPTFDSVYTGYTQPEAKAITITSSGNSDATISSVTVSGDSFTVGGSGSSVPAGESITTWTIQPAAGLTAGTHTGTITVTYDNSATATAEVSFVVNRQSSGGGSITYPPTIPTTGNGDVTVSPARPERGDTVTVTVEPDDRYKVEDVTVTDRNGDPVEVSLKNDGTYTFVQPAGKVEIEVTYAVDMPFTDVPEDAWYIDGAEYVYANYIMNGTGETTFGPNTTVSRGMIVQILYNLVGNPDVEGDTDFTDVTDDYWSAKAIAWAASNGVVNGFEDGTFRPDENMTREQMAAILQNFAYQMGLDVSASGDLSNFTDIPEGEYWSRDALAWAYAEGLLAGTSDSTMDPAGQASRAQIAVIMMRFCEQYVETAE